MDESGGGRLRAAPPLAGSLQNLVVGIRTRGVGPFPGENGDYHSIPVFATDALLRKEETTTWNFDAVLLGVLLEMGDDALDQCW